MCPDGFRDEPLDYTEVRSIRRTLGDSWRRVTSEIAVRREAEQSLAALVEEKQMLLQEIHHRVKNNLQVVVSLLALEERRISSPEAHAALMDSRNRIMSMAYVHELLYRGESTTHVRLNEYLADLIGGIDGTTNHEARISFDIEAHPACVRLDTAIPTGLIVTELVTNALKHAYQPGESGAISVRAYPVDDGDADRARLVVADAGSGMDAAVFEQRTGATSLGLEIVRSLCSQLRTELVREPSEQGTVLSFTIDTMNDC
jgi:two-component sensor histidine kinase